MPDIASARPVAGAPIETAWGTDMHDAVEGVQAGKANAVFSAATAVAIDIVFPRAFTGGAGRRRVAGSRHVVYHVLGRQYHDDGLPASRMVAGLGHGDRADSLGRRRHAGVTRWDRVRFWIWLVGLLPRALAIWLGLRRITPPPGRTGAR